MDKDRNALAITDREATRMRRTASLILALHNEPASVAQLAIITSMSQRNVRRYLDALNTHKILPIRVADWEWPKKGWATPKYQVGEGPDVACPPRPYKAMTDAEKNRRWRKKLKADPDRYEAYRDKKNTARRKAKPDKLAVMYSTPAQSPAPLQ